MPSQTPVHHVLLTPTSYHHRLLHQRICFANDESSCSIATRPREYLECLPCMTWYTLQSSSSEHENQHRPVSFAIGHSGCAPPNRSATISIQFIAAITTSFRRRHHYHHQQQHHKYQDTFGGRWGNENHVEDSEVGKC